MTDTIEDEEEEGMACIVCWEDFQADDDETATTNAARSVVLLKPCLHQACRSCICTWIERCEETKQDQVRCPHCRQVIDNLNEILGRPYCHSKQQPQTTTTNSVADTTEEDNGTPMDGNTQAWLLQNNAHQCTNCGIYMVREEGDEAYAVMCLCGWRYCFSCMEDADDCPCEHDEFYDNFLDMDVNIRDGREHLVATTEDLEDFAAFLRARENAAREEDSQYNDEDDEEEAVVEEALVVEEPEEASLLPLFAECA